MNVYNFEEQIKVGDAGEEEFRLFYKDRLNPIKPKNDYSYDFGVGNKKIELKTDTYRMDSTENFFMERWANYEQTKVGGPWRASKDAVDYFVYYFRKDKTFFWFDTYSLNIRLDEIVKSTNPRLINIVNNGYSVWGYLIKRKDLTNICKKIEVNKQ